jgi:hypothetical protein
MGPGGGVVFSAIGNEFKELTATDLGTFNWATAITTAQNYTGGGFNNWRLPDISELTTIRGNTARVVFSSSGNYWSSTEVNANQAYSMWMTSTFISNPTPDTEQKTSLFRVRAVRNFTH